MNQSGMEPQAAEQLISDLYEYCLRRKPADSEYRHWVDHAIAGGRPERIVRAFYSSPEFRTKNSVNAAFSPGHYHSPVVDPNTAVKEYVTRERTAQPEQIHGINLSLESMRQLWLENLDIIRETPFTDEPSELNRYYSSGGPFPLGDALTLRFMVFHHRPKRVIEIGSGRSSACMLDAAEQAGLGDFHLTCIEPYADRLKSLLRQSDMSRVKIIEEPVQNVPSHLVDKLEPGDMFFVDSTHVVKTGSDVHYEFFHMLPRLQPGVVVHFHDIPYPFEYPDGWIFHENYSWNEAYLLRAFLMYNRDFRILFWSQPYAMTYKAQIRAEYPSFPENPGGSIWLVRE